MRASPPKRHALVGCGARGLSFVRALAKRPADRVRLVGMCDVNPGRMAYFNRFLGTEVPAFADLGEMVATAKPDTVIVCSRDALHHEHAIRAMEMGCDVICEKPMTVDEAKCRAILDVERRTGRRVTVAFNFRFGPYATRAKELLAGGVIGRVLSIDFQYWLDRRHGADYFRRWHRRKEESGGLLVTKATHHFDFVNWLLGQDPVEVFAHGSRLFYGPVRAERGIRCRGCDYRSTCEFFFDMDNPSTRGTVDDQSALYAENEVHDGYVRDSCVFADEIDIEDTLSLAVRYSGGTQMSYSLIAHCVFEGFRLALNGTEGRMELPEREAASAGLPIVIHRPGCTVETRFVPLGEGDHGGADERLFAALFDGPRPDPLGHVAGALAGAMSVLVGAAANRSMATGRRVLVNELIEKETPP